jgi:hypothetical protein
MRLWSCTLWTDFDALSLGGLQQPVTLGEQLRLGKAFRAANFCGHSLRGGAVLAERCVKRGLAEPGGGSEQTLPQNPLRTQR